MRPPRAAMSPRAPTMMAKEKVPSSGALSSNEPGNLVPSDASHYNERQQGRKRGDNELGITVSILIFTRSI